MPDIGGFLQGIWLADGFSEFASALLGGAFAIGAQQLAVIHDRKKDAKIADDLNKARAWAIYFKIAAINEVITEASQILASAQATASKNGVELWQVLQFPPHDWQAVTWETEELVLLIDHKKFDLMQTYQEGTWWVSNYIQSAQLYREMRLEFLQSRPGALQSAMEPMGSMTFTSRSDYEAVLPTLIHLKTLADSIASVIANQQPQARRLLKDYASVMKDMIGHRPTIEFKDEQNQGGE